MTRFYCPQILLSDGWAENQLLEVDGLGTVSYTHLTLPTILLV